MEENLDKHVVYSWGASDAMRKGSLLIDRGEGVYVIDFEGKKYYDWTSQAICTNFGYTVPQKVVDGITK